MMSAVGDAVHVFPLVNAIKRTSPDTRITWILQPAPAELVRGHPAVDEIIVFERPLGFGAYFDLRRKLAGKRFGMVINLQVYLKAGIVTTLVDADIKLGFDRTRARDINWIFTNVKIPRKPMQHVQDQYFEFLDWLGIDPHPIEWKVGPWGDEIVWQREFVAMVGRQYVSIVVATSKAEKDWIPERWARVVDLLYENYGLSSVLVGGRSNREIRAAEIITKQSVHKPVVALGSGIRRLVSILDGSELIISPDTGPLHIAVGLDKPVISLIGYTNPLRTGPYRKFQDLIVDAYGDPGELYPITMEVHPHRMHLIRVEDVMGRVARWDRAYRQRRVSAAQR